jgi:hypothetical protein
MIGGGGTVGENVRINTLWFMVVLITNTFNI